MVVEIVAFSRIYGVSRLYRDVEFMLKRELCLFWAFCWGFLVPVFLSFIWIYFTFFTDPLAYKNQKFPESYLCKLRNIFDRELALLVLQGISLWNVSFKLTLTDRNMQVRFCLKVSVYSWDYGIWVSSTSFQKSNIGWPQQPPTEKLLKFHLIFHDSTKKLSFFKHHKNIKISWIQEPGWHWSHH